MFKFSRFAAVGTCKRHRTMRLKRSSDKVQHSTYYSHA